MEEAPTTLVSASGGGSSAAEPALIRSLASCNKSTRDRALRLVIKSWLPSQQPNQVSDDDMKKLWKGLFYCVWHADKSGPQSDLINRLSSLLLSLDLSLSLHYLSVFFLTLRREWPGIDGLRLDKFYLLIRRFFHSSFLMLKKNYSWDFEVLNRFIGVVEERTFFADDKFLGNGVNYHIATIFLEELEPFLPLKLETLEVMFRPFLRVMSVSCDKVLVGKVRSNMFDVLLKMGRSLLEVKKSGDDPDRRVVVLGTISLTMGFSTRFYDLGSSPECFQGNRKFLFSLHEEFLRLEKDLELAGIEISAPDAMVDNGHEVPELIPVDTSVCANAVVVKPLKKKNKKDKRDNEKTKALDGANKKAMKRKNKKKNGIPEQCLAVVENGDTIISNGTNSDETNLIFNESVISNLQMQFEKVAAEVALDKDGSSSFDSPENTIRTRGLKKRKRVRVTGEEDTGLDTASAAVISSGKTAKKVRFSMKNNLVWKPHSPLPPQDLRLPPSVTPRGSALKKGIPPGPIREMPPATKKVKKKKKGRRVIKTISPAIKRLRKL